MVSSCSTHMSEQLYIHELCLVIWNWSLLEQQCLSMCCIYIIYISSHSCARIASCPRTISFIYNFQPPLTVLSPHTQLGDHVIFILRAALDSHQGGKRLLAGLVHRQDLVFSSLHLTVLGAAALPQLHSVQHDHREI